jgi:5'-nucleotidase
MNSRRDFIKTMLIGGGLLGLQSTALGELTSGAMVKITILHTNDTHSHIEPFPDNDPKYPGLGGFARRAAMIKNIRRIEKNVLLFDSGDVYQGSPYFNMYGGEVEFRLMSEMGYDAMTIGNHEFDNGVEGIANQLKHASFAMISSNYDFSDTSLAGKVEPFKIFKMDGVVIGVFGLGIELKGLVNKKAYGGTRYLDPREKAAETAHFLKKDLNCDLVICLSHLGYSYKDDKISDIVIAKQSKNIDLILGGHTHTFIDQPYVLRNSDDEEIIIGQVGWGGVKLGRVDYYLIKRAGIKFADAWTEKIKKNNG